jgi:endogenous inhibitor of DNA gyrase (YacG/DUF329 family)
MDAFSPLDRRNYIEWDDPRWGRRGRYTEPLEPLWEPLVEALGVPMPPRWELREAGPCHLCGKTYWQHDHSRGFYCSDHCANLARRARYAIVQGAIRAMARAGRECRRCGKPLKAKRSTKRYCSTKCRIAAHRGA